MTNLDKYQNKECEYCGAKPITECICEPFDKTLRWRKDNWTEEDKRKCREENERQIKEIIKQRGNSHD